MNVSPNLGHSANAKLVNFIGFKICWWCAILLQSSAVPILIAFILLHVYFNRERHLELLVTFIVAYIGYATDSILTLIGIFEFHHSTALFAPFWLLLLWCCFSTTLIMNRDAWPRHKGLLVLLGGLAGVVSYSSAGYLDAVSFQFGVFISMLVVAFVWMLMIPAFKRIIDSSLEAEYAAQLD
jgi:hypothetical protein